MTIKELIEELQKFPDDYPVYLFNGDCPTVFMDQDSNEIILE